MYNSLPIPQFLTQIFIKINFLIFSILLTQLHNINFTTLYYAGYVTTFLKRQVFHLQKCIIFINYQTKK